MTLSIMKPIVLAAFLAASPALATQMPGQTPGQTPDHQTPDQMPETSLADNASQADSVLAANTLAQGQSVRAIEMLEANLEQSPDDPALLINLGIAHAQTGNEDGARKLFQAALSSRHSVDLDTANGMTTDSRRLARQALTMLDRGEFAPASPDQLTWPR
jgi:Tfp pilus assembly protein PilF